MSLKLGLNLTKYHSINFDLPKRSKKKIIFVILLSAYHFFCLRCIDDFKNDRNKHSAKFFRITNELPSVALIFIIILVVFQPF